MLKQTRRTVGLISGALALALLAGACGKDTGGASGLSGTINGDGSSTVHPITEAVAEEFNKENPQVDISVGVSGTGGGFEKFCNGETDIQNASRAIKDEERQKCVAKGVSFVELTVARDGLAVVVHKDNAWAQCLTVGELNEVWKPGSKVKNWSQIRTGFPDQDLKLYGPGTDSGTFDYFTKEINGEEGESRTDYTASEDDNTLVTGVGGDRGALGYFGFAYYAENKDKLKVLGVDAGEGCVVPSDATVKDGTYHPLSRPLFVYVKESSIAREEVKTFVDFMFASVNDLLADVGYTPLADAELQKELDEWTAASA